MYVMNTTSKQIALSIGHITKVDWSEDVAVVNDGPPSAGL